MLLRALRRHHPTMICLRDKGAKYLRKEAAAFLRVAREEGVVCTLLHGDYKVAKKLGFMGVHLPANRFEEIPQAKRAGLIVIASTHSEDEIAKAQKLGADMVTFSPIFYTPNKGEPKGLLRLRKAVRGAKIPIIALGGIVAKREVHKVKIKRAGGFASIRYFVR